MNKEITQILRPPVVVIMGHVDHGKSTLLDFIRKTNIVEKEAGGITQKIAAYEAEHSGKKITFLDTPGHEAFSRLRERGAALADIAILIVAATDGVQAQTIEAAKVITQNNLPFIVAINKVDKPGADIQKTINQLAENGVYLERFGGNVPFAEISAKTGQGVPELLDLINLVAEMNDFTGNPEERATGIVVESHMDPKRGIAATIIIKNGILKKGMFVVAGSAVTSTRIIENFLGKPIQEATFSSPVVITGFDNLPNPGSSFESFESKKEAEEKTRNVKFKEAACEKFEIKPETKLIPLVIKADFSGSLEAIEKELKKICGAEAAFRIVGRGLSDITENDVLLASGNPESVIAGFNVKINKSVRELAETYTVAIGLFEIIYELTDWLKKELEKRTPKKEVLVTSGKARVLKIFSVAKEKQIVGGEVMEGAIRTGAKTEILRRNVSIGEAKITSLEKNKAKTSEVEAPAQFGMMLESKIEVAPGDVLEAKEKSLM